MLAGRIRCDFCGFIGEMEFQSSNKSIMQVPDMWVSIHPMIVVSGKRGIGRKDPARVQVNEIKRKVKEKVRSLHACPGCSIDKNVFDLQLALPPSGQVAYDKANPMKETAT